MQWYRNNYHKRVHYAITWARWHNESEREKETREGSVNSWTMLNDQTKLYFKHEIFKCLQWMEWMNYGVKRKNGEKFATKNHVSEEWC